MGFRTFKSFKPPPSSTPAVETVSLSAQPHDVMSEAKHLEFSGTYEDEILRLWPQDDIATQSRHGGGKQALSGVDGRWGRPRNDLNEWNGWSAP